MFISIYVGIVPLKHDTQTACYAEVCTFLFVLSHLGCCIVLVYLSLPRSSPCLHNCCVARPLAMSSVNWSVILMRQGFEFKPRSGHVEEATNECINKWNNTLMFLSLLSSFFLKSINKLKKNLRYGEVLSRKGLRFTIYLLIHIFCTPVGL